MRVQADGKQWKFQLAWLEKFPWLLYSKSYNAGCCLRYLFCACFFFVLRRTTRSWGNYIGDHWRTLPVSSLPSCVHPQYKRCSQDQYGEVRELQGIRASLLVYCYYYFVALAVAIMLCSFWNMHYAHLLFERSSRCQGRLSQVRRVFIHNNRIVYLIPAITAIKKEIVHSNVEELVARLMEVTNARDPQALPHCCLRFLSL